MQDFDSRKARTGLSQLRFAAICGAFAALAVAWHMASVPAHGLTLQSHSRISAVEALHRATQPTTASATTVSIQVKRGETVQGALERAGLSRDEARQAVSALAPAFDAAHFRAGLTLNLAMDHDPQGALQLANLSLRTGLTSQVSLSRSPDGSFLLHRQDEALRDDNVVAEGAIRGSLYDSIQAVGATPAISLQVARLFSHKLDFSRDIQPGDRFRLIFQRQVTAGGRTVKVGDLDYAEIDAKGTASQFYRYQAPGQAKPEYFDASGKTTRAFLLKTPVDGARITSGFGMRFHPILGYTRMHQGVDFGVPKGTPVYAAGDGVVEQARWDGGYGRFVKLKHTNGWETAYGHLSRWAVRAGERVHQGEVIAYSGSTGESTGPHLHFEVIKNGVKINPRSAEVPAGWALSGAQLAAFRAQKAHTDLLLAGAGRKMLAVADEGGRAVLRR